MDSLPGKFKLVLFLGLITALFSTSCSSDDPTSPSPTSLIQLSGTVGAAGGTLASNDGSLSVTFPAGALGADTEIVITELAADEVPDVFDGLVVEKAFNVEPVGLDLTADAEISLTLDLEPPATKAVKNGDLQVHIETRFLVVSNEDLDELGLPDTALEIGDDRTFRGSVGELNTFCIAGTQDPLLWIAGQLSLIEDVLASQPFSTIITLLFSNYLGCDPETAFLVYSANSFTFELEDGDPITHDSETNESDGSTTRTYTVQTTATESGTQSLACGLEFSVIPELAVFDGLDLEPGAEPPTLSITYDLPPIPVDVDEPDPDSGSPAVGVYNVGLSSCEGLGLVIGLTDWELDETVAVSSGDGLSFLDLNSDPPLQVSNDDFAMAGVLYYGNAIIKHGFKNAKTVGYTILLISPDGGAWSGWVPENHGFGMTGLFGFNQNLTDALPYGNNPASGKLCYVNNTLGGVYLLEYDNVQETLQSAGTVSGFPGATGQAVSAYVRDGGSLLTAVDGTPGRLYLHDLSSIFDPATYVCDLGDSPRRIRSVGDVAAISNYESGTLTIVSWSQADDVAVSETVSVGDGPVGIDLLELSGGTVAIVSTGFNDDTFWVTVVSSTGTLISNTEYALPVGLSGPGHAIWLRDVNNRIMISGNTTGNLAVVASGL